MSEDSEMVTFRLAPRDRAAIQKLIESGEFRNRSDFLRYAVKATLADYEPHAAKATLDLNIDTAALRRGLSRADALEGVDLPPQPAKAKARPRSKEVNL